MLSYTILEHEDGREEIKCGFEWEKIYEYLDSLDLEDYADFDDLKVREVLE